MGKLYVVPTPVGNLEDYDFSRYPHIEGSGFGAGRRHAYFRNIAEAF